MQAYMCTCKTGMQQNVNVCKEYELSKFIYANLQWKILACRLKISRKNYAYEWQKGLKGQEETGSGAIMGVAHSKRKWK